MEINLVNPIQMHYAVSNVVLQQAAHVQLNLHLLNAICRRPDPSRSDSVPLSVRLHVMSQLYIQLVHLSATHKINVNIAQAHGFVDKHHQHAVS